LTFSGDFAENAFRELASTSTLSRTSLHRCSTQGDAHVPETGSPDAASSKCLALHVHDDGEDRCPVHGPSYPFTLLTKSCAQAAFLRKNSSAKKTILTFSGDFAENASRELASTSTLSRTSLHQCSTQGDAHVPETGSPDAAGDVGVSAGDASLSTKTEA
jgi:hypothetical protein